MFESARHAKLEPDLRYQAMLYAAGEMDPIAAAAFESLLGTEADVQQALIQAVQLAGLLDGRNPVPSPAYRSVVRKTLFGANRRRRSRWLKAACAGAAARAGGPGRER